MQHQKSKLERSSDELNQNNSPYMKKYNILKASMLLGFLVNEQIVFSWVKKGMQILDELCLRKYFQPAFFEKTNRGRWLWLK